MKLCKPSLRRLLGRLAAITLLTSIAWPAAAGGFLWLSGESAQPISIYRYNLQTGMIDKVVKPTFGSAPFDPLADVYNNLAYDGKNLYIGSDDDNSLSAADPLSGVISSSTSYSPTPNPASSWEDGAFDTRTGNLWRAGTNSVLLETTVGGLVVGRFNVVDAPSLDGLEWVGNTLYATTFSAFGKVNFSGSTATFQEIFGLGTTVPAGYPLDQSPEGLALDQQTNLLYMVSTNSFFGGMDTFLWTVDPIAGTVNLVRDLVDAGYPASGTGGSPINPDAMGWVPAAVPEPTSPALFIAGLIALLCHQRQRKSKA